MSMFSNTKFDFYQKESESNETNQGCQNTNNSHNCHNPNNQTQLDKAVEVGQEVTETMQMLMASMHVFKEMSTWSSSPSISSSPSMNQTNEEQKYDPNAHPHHHNNGAVGNYCPDPNHYEREVRQILNYNPSTAKVPGFIKEGFGVTKYNGKMPRVGFPDSIPDAVKKAYYFIKTKSRQEPLTAPEVRDILQFFGFTVKMINSVFSLIDRFGL